MTTPIYSYNTPAKQSAKLEDLYCTDPLKACRKALRLTRGVRWQDRLDAINDLLGMHGAEAIRGEWKNGYWCDIVAAYCNTGDMYALTVFHVRGEGWNERGNFIITSWDEWVEKNSRKYAIE